MKNRPLTKPIRILLVEDSEHDRLAFRRAFRKSDLYVDITEVVRAEDALVQMETADSSFDVVVTDYKLPGMSGLDFCRYLLQQNLPFPLILMTGGGSELLAVDALKAGVGDYLIKDPDGGYLELLPIVVPEVIRRHGDRLARQRAEAALKQSHQDLERRVKARTAELQETNIRLQQEIIERQRTEQALQQAKEAAEAANRAKSLFLANMSHELRTPLNAILGHTRLLQQDENLTEHQLKKLDTVVSSGEHLLHFINDLLDVSSLEVNRLELQMTDFCLPDFLNNICQDIQPLARHKGLEFKVQYDQYLPRGVRSDKQRLQQILFNLLDNAVKFTHHGQVIFRVYRSKEQGVRSKEALNLEPCPSNLEPSILLRFEIQDSGQGIEAEQLNAIVQPFQQIEQNNYSSMHVGAGLGLALCQGLLRMMGSSLQVRSAPGQGSVFFFELKMRRAEGDFSTQKTASDTLASSELSQSSVKFSEAVSLAQALPDKHREPLQQAALLGIRKQVFEQIYAIEHLGPQFRPLVTLLRQLAQDFEMEKIADLLQ